MSCREEAFSTASSSITTTLLASPRVGGTRPPGIGLLYRYRRGTGKPASGSINPGAGIGDIQLTGGFQLYQSPVKPSRAAAVRASLKLPTGDSADLHGSGSTDLALWLTGSDDYLLAIGRFKVFGAAGMMGLTRGDVLADQPRNVAGFGSLGAGWSPSRWIAFKVQANGHTAFYRESSLRELNAASVQLTIGGTLAFGETIQLDVGVTEDVIVKTAPDVVFHLGLRVGL